MRKLLLIAVSVMFCLGLAVTSSYSAKPGNSFKPEITSAQNPELDFTIVNKTGSDIKALSIGASGVDWTKEDEVLKGRAPSRALASRTTLSSTPKPRQRNGILW